MSAKSLLVLIIFLAVVFVGAYLMLQPKSAFDIGAFRDTLEQTDKQMKAYSRLADTDNLPGWLQMKVDYYEDQAQIIEDNLPDCTAVVVALEERSGEFRQAMQNLDQAAAMQEMLKSGKKQQARLAATIVVVSSEWAHTLLPLIEEVCDSCPEESEVFNRVLSF